MGGGGGGGFRFLYLLLPLPVPFNPLPAPFRCGSILFVPFLLRNITKCCQRFLNYFQFPLPALSFLASRPISPGLPLSCPHPLLRNCRATVTQCIAQSLLRRGSQWGVRCKNPLGKVSAGAKEQDSLSGRSRHFIAPALTTYSGLSPPKTSQSP